MICNIKKAQAEPPRTEPPTVVFVKTKLDNHLLERWRLSSAPGCSQWVPNIAEETASARVKVLSNFDACNKSQEDKRLMIDTDALQLFPQSCFFFSGKAKSFSPSKEE